jgi:hypothetical protein
MESRSLKLLISLLPLGITDSSGITLQITYISPPTKAALSILS